MHRKWQLRAARGNFSRLIRRAVKGYAQVVTVHGRPAAVVVSARQYTGLMRRRGKLSAVLLRPEPLLNDVMALAAALAKQRG